MNLDYGWVQPLHLMLPTEFASIIREHVSGVLYSPPAIFPGCQPFTLGLIVDGTSPAQALFEAFRGWGSEEAASDGLQVTIQVQDDLHYQIYFGPALSTLLPRIVPGSLSTFLNVRVGLIHQAKSITAAQPHLAEFRRIWDGRPVTLQAYLPTRPYPQAIDGARLTDVHLRIVDQPDATNISFLSGDAQTDHAAPESDLSPAAVFERREQALRRYFPVTLERLQTTPSVLAIRQTLAATGLQGWQLDQAMCTLSLDDRFTMNKAGQEALCTRSPADVLRALEDDPEHIRVALPPVTAAHLRDQVLGDALALARAIDPQRAHRRRTVQTFLAERGYLHREPGHARSASGVS